MKISDDKINRNKKKLYANLQLKIIIERYAVVGIIKKQNSGCRGETFKMMTRNMFPKQKRTGKFETVKLFSLT